MKVGEIWKFKKHKTEYINDQFNTRFGIKVPNLKAKLTKNVRACIIGIDERTVYIELLKVSGDNSGRQSRIPHDMFLDLLERDYDFGVDE